MSLTFTAKLALDRQTVETLQEWIGTVCLLLLGVMLLVKPTYLVCRNSIQTKVKYYQETFSMQHLETDFPTKFFMKTVMDALRQ